MSNSSATLNLLLCAPDRSVSVYLVDFGLAHSEVFGDVDARWERECDRIDSEGASSDALGAARGDPSLRQSERKRSREVRVCQCMPRFLENDKISNLDCCAYSNDLRIPLTVRFAFTCLLSVSPSVAGNRNICFSFLMI